MKPAKPRDERYFDAGAKLHVAFDLSYIKYTELLLNDKIIAFCLDIFLLMFFNFKYLTFYVKKLDIKDHYIYVIYMVHVLLDKN
jgi:hypothetical protein